MVEDNSSSEVHSVTESERTVISIDMEEWDEKRKVICKRFASESKDKDPLRQ